MEGLYGKAAITLKDGTKHIYKANDEDAISDFLYSIVGDSTREEISGIPTFIEASSWCPEARIGDTFEREEFTIEITE